MTIPSDVVKSDLLLSAISELQDLPHITNLNELLIEAITSLQSLLLKKTYESWPTTEGNSAFKKFQDALQKALR